jgi:uncharacterized repeat protein (TIGR03803 family)
MTIFVADQIVPYYAKSGLRGAAALLGVVMCAILPASARHFRVLHNFSGSPDGANPNGTLIRDASGNFYGVTNSGGAYNYGTIFKIDSHDSETVLYSFKGKRNGSQPQGIVRDAAGNFYGTTQLGGKSGLGTIFKLTPSGHFTVLHSFAGSPSDGAYPQAGPFLDAAGNLYGVTVNGGSVSGACTSQGCGIIFTVDAAGNYSILHSFAGYPTDGARPNAPFVQDSAGNLYSTTNLGGTVFCSYSTPGCGTVFMITPAGTETILHSFAGPPRDGNEPSGGLFRDDKGGLYGTTVNGGRYSLGNVFKLNRQGKMITLFSFGEPGVNAEYPSSGVVRDALGNLYGTTEYGGHPGCSGSGCGTIFEVSRSRAGSVLFAFPSSAVDGAVPTNGQIFDMSGDLFGLVPFGGANGYGVVYKITP